METVHIEQDEVTIEFPGHVTLEISLVGKSVDIRASVRGRRAWVRTGTAALPELTIDIVERRGPEE